MANNINKIAKSLKKSIKTEKGTKAYDTAATVTRIEGKTAWVHIPGGVEETPVKLTMNAKKGETVQVRVSGGKAWLTGNASAPPTDDTTANKAQTTATEAKYAADNATAEAVRAKDAADRAETSAQEAQTSAANALTSANEAKASATEANNQAISATNSANNALTQLGTVENVVDTLTWIEDNAAFEASTDTSVVAGKTYYVPSNQLLTLTDSTTTTSGLTIVVKDGIVTVNGTATGNVYLELGTPSATAGSTIYISGVSGGSWGNYGLRYAQAGGAVFVYDDVNKTTAVNNAKLYVYVGSGYAATDLRMYPLVSNTNDGLQYSVVESPSGNPSTNGYYELNIDDAVKTYVQSHLALTDAGLYVLNDASAYKMLLANDGMYIQAPNGTTVNQSTANGNVIKASNGTVIANLGYGEGSTPSSSSETDAPYYTFGTRKTTAQEYNTSTTYAVGDLCIYNGKQYVCVSATTGSWNAIKWRLTLGNWSVVEGRDNISSGGGHTEGRNNLDIGSNNHIEGSNNKAIGTGTIGDYAHNAHVGGEYCVVTGDGEGESNACFAHGIGVRSGGPAAFSIGRYNANGYSPLTVGNGTSDNSRSNALRLDDSGNLRLLGDVYIGCNTDSSGGTKLVNGGGGGGGDVTGVKGNAESTYRTGNVNLTPANIGAIDTAGTGLTKSSTTLNHTNSITAQTTQALYPIKIDAQGHISAYGSAVTIPTVNDATLTIQKNGTDVQTFTANASSNKTANIIVPTKTSDLTNDSNFITSSDIPAEVFIATYGTTSYSDILDAYNDWKVIFCDNGSYCVPLSRFANSTFYFHYFRDGDAGVYTRTASAWQTTTSSYVPSSRTINSKALSSDITLSATDVGAQETLVSGTNIKTINNESILGSGNISISSGGGGETMYDESTSSTISTIYSTGRYATNFIVTPTSVSDLSVDKCLKMRAYQIWDGKTSGDYGVVPLIITYISYTPSNGYVTVSCKSIMSDVQYTSASYTGTGYVHFVAPFEIASVTVSGGM